MSNKTFQYLCVDIGLLYNKPALSFQHFMICTCFLLLPCPSMPVYVPDNMCVSGEAGAVMKVSG